jgi:hypothetical protein
VLVDWNSPLSLLELAVVEAVVELVVELEDEVEEAVEIVEAAA